MGGLCAACRLPRDQPSTTAHQVQDRAAAHPFLSKHRVYINMFPCRPRTQRRTLGAAAAADAASDHDQENRSSAHESQQVAAAGHTQQAVATGFTPSRLACISALRDELSCGICLEICVRPCATPCGGWWTSSSTVLGPVLVHVHARQILCIHMLVTSHGQARRNQHHAMCRSVCSLCT